MKMQINIDFGARKKGQQKDLDVGKRFYFTKQKKTCDLHPFH